jgi:hypothetical protein
MLINYFDYNLPGEWGTRIGQRYGTSVSTFFPDASDKLNLYYVDSSDTYEPSCALVVKYLYSNTGDCTVRPSIILCWPKICLYIQSDLNLNAINGALDQLTEHYKENGTTYFVAYMRY